MLKLLGLLFIVFSGAGAGCLAAMGLRQERIIMERLCQMLRELSVQMEFRGASVQELLEQLAQEPAYEMFSFPERMLAELQSGVPLSTAWRTGLQADAAVPENARQLLLPLGDELGVSDLCGQVETLAQYRQQLEPYAEETWNRCTQRQRLYVSMGVLGGLMAAILFC